MNWYDILHTPYLSICHIYPYPCVQSCRSPCLELPPVLTANSFYAYPQNKDSHLPHLFIQQSIYWGFPGVSEVKSSACNAEDLGREDPLEKEMATHSSILAWEIPWTEEPGGLQSTGSQKSRTRLSNFTFTFIFTYTPDMEQLETYCD